MSTNHSSNIRRRSLIIMMVSGFLSALGVALVSLVLPLASLDAKVGVGWLGSCFGGFFLARVLAGPIAGRWADNQTPKSPLLFGTGLATIIPYLYWLHPEVLSLYVIQFALGIVSGLIRPVAMAVVGTTTELEERSKWFSYHVLMMNAAMFLGPLVGGLLFWNRRAEPVLLGLSICMGLAWLLIYLFVPRVMATSKALQKSRKASRLRKSFGSLLTAIWGRTFGIGLAIAFYPVLLSLAVAREGLVVGFLYALPALATCLFLPIVRRVEYRYGSDFMIIGLLISGAGLGAIGLSREMYQFVLSGILVGAGSAFSIPASMAQVSASSQSQGKGFGLTHAVSGVGFASGAVFGGLGVSVGMQVGQIFVIAGLTGCACVIPWLIRERRVLGAVIVGIALFIGGATALDGKDSVNDGLYRYSEIAMGTVVNLTLEADSQKAADNAARKTFAFMRALQRDYDFRVAEGSVGRINSFAGKSFVQPTRRAYELIERTIEFSRLTHGIFDPTVGALTTSPLYYVLDETIARSKKDLVGYDLVRFDEQGKRILLPKQGMALDLGGIAKGSVIDAAVKLLRGLKIRSGIVEAGGDFYCFGDRDWAVGIQHPRDESVYRTITVRERGVCGSGDYRQFIEFEKDGEKELRHHIINPASMEPADESLGVTVIAESAELADGMATAAFIMGPDKGRSFLEASSPEVAAIWFTADSLVRTTADFPTK